MTERDTDQALVDATAGDEAAFALLVREHQSMVFSFAYHFLRDAARAEEVAQEVFLHLYRHLDTIESPAHLTYWLRRVASHRCIDESRRKARRKDTVALEAIAEPASERRERDPFLSGSLRKLVAALPEQQRAVVVLRYQEDMEPGEIAELLEIPLNTVKSRLHRAVEFLRSKLERIHKVV